MQKSLLITGASSGIGKATAKAFVSAGHNVFAVARRGEKLKEIKNQLGDLFTYEVVDLSKSQEIDDFFKSHSKSLDTIDTLVNNAGLALGKEGFSESDIDDAQTMVQTNVNALLKFSHHTIQIFKKNKLGHVINLGSVAGITPYAGGTVYCATKAAVHMLSDALRMDLGGTNIRVSVVAPGRVAETEFSQVRYKGDEKMAQSVYEGYRIMTSTDVAETILWIASRPQHINIQQVVILPTDQPSATTLAPFKT